MRAANAPATIAAALKTDTKYRRKNKHNAKEKESQYIFIGSRVLFPLLFVPVNTGNHAALKSRSLIREGISEPKN